jgi:hypothetical protein
MSPALVASAPPTGSLSSSAGDLFERIWPTLLVLLLIAIVGGLFAMWLRRRLGAKEESSPAGFSLEDLRRMHREGEMSDEEFERAKTAMLASRPSRESMADKLIAPTKRSGGNRPEGRRGERGR